MSATTMKPDCPRTADGLRALAETVAQARATIERIQRNEGDYYEGVSRLAHELLLAREQLEQAESAMFKEL